MHAHMIGRAPPKIPMVALIAPVRQDLQQRANHSLQNSPSSRLPNGVAAAPRTGLLLVEVYGIHKHNLVNYRRQIAYAAL
jgi:hypothetical protein